MALSFRLHRILPWDVVGVLVRHRGRLRIDLPPCLPYGKAALADPCKSRLARFINLMQRASLDLNFRYVDDQLVVCGGPRAIDASEAVRLYIQQVPGSQIRPPLPLSWLSNQIVRFASAVLALAANSEDVQPSRVGTLHREAQRPI